MEAPSRRAGWRSPCFTVQRHNCLVAGVSRRNERSVELLPISGGRHDAIFRHPVQLTVPHTERLMGRWSRKVGRDFLRWCNVPPGADMARCGLWQRAHSLEEISRRMPQPASVQGIDPSAGADRLCPQAIRRCAWPDFQVGDAQDLPFGNAEVRRCRHGAGDCLRA